MALYDLFMAIGSALSIFCSLLVLGSHARSSKRPLKAFDYPIIAITLSDLCFCVGYFVNECKAEEIMNGTGCLSSVLFTSTVPWLVFLATISWRGSLSYFFWWYSLLCLLLSLCAGVTPYFIGAKMKDECWVSAANSWRLDLTRFATFYIPFWIVLTWSLIVFCWVTPKRQPGTDSEILAANRRRTKYYPIVLLASFGLMFIVRVLESSEVSQSQDFFYQFASILTTLSGVGNAGVYFVTDGKAGLRTAIQKLAVRLLGWE